MTQTPQNPPNSGLQSSTNALNIEDLVRSLRRKEGSWVDWGHACAALLKAGYSSNQIFEETGFEPVQQNQVSVAAQVYTSLVNSGASEEVRSHFWRKGSDVLYEFRILTQTERLAAATLILTHNLDADDAHLVAKAVKEYSRIRRPAGFTDDAGDAVAYQCWKLAREKSDLQERSRLIARGLKLAGSLAARQQIEQLLTDFTVVPQRTAPRLPIYRLEAEEDLPRIIPVAGKLPIATSDWQAVPLTEETGPFQMVKFSATGAWVTLPGWQVIKMAEDPVAIIGKTDDFPTALQGKDEEVLIIVDRAQRQWDIDSYFLLDNAGNLELQWFEEAAETRLLGKVILVMRPKIIIEKDANSDRWEIED
jgi:Rubisco Assembly chaperone C-terminal domain/Rubisco accumulation factor 1 alpha helical domain/Rubisco accumulation factor 1 helix turn helix domain